MLVRRQRLQLGLEQGRPNRRTNLRQVGARCRVGEKAHRPESGKCIFDAVFETLRQAGQRMKRGWTIRYIRRAGAAVEHQCTLVLRYAMRGWECARPRPPCGARLDTDIYRL